MTRTHMRVALVATLVAVWWTGTTVTSQQAASRRAATAMTAAATKFLEGLTPEQRPQASFPLDTEERTRWNFIPTNMFPRKGVPIKEMTEAAAQAGARPAQGRARPARAT